MLTARNSPWLIGAALFLTAATTLPSAFADDLFVTNNAGNTIGEYTTAGATINASLVSSGLNGPSGIAVSGSNLFVTNYYTGTVGEYTTAGAVVNASLITGMEGPTTIVISGSNLFILDALRGAVAEYTTAGAPVNTSLITGLYNSGPMDMAISGSNLYIVEHIAGKVAEYNTSGTKLNGSLITGLFQPYSIAVSSSDLFVAGNAGTPGYVVGEYATAGATVNADLVSMGELVTPFDIALSGSNIFIADPNSNEISEYNTSGGTVNQFLITDLQGPHGLALVSDAPEPASLALLALAAPLFLTRRRRRV